jgi:hypothetical protein
VAVLMLSLFFLLLLLSSGLLSVSCAPSKEMSVWNLDFGRLVLLVISLFSGLDEADPIKRDLGIVDTGADSLDATNCSSLRCWK